MIRLADGTEWNAFTPEELQGAIRAGGKSAQLWEDIHAMADLPQGKRLYLAGRRSKSLLGEAQARFQPGDERC